MSFLRKIFDFYINASIHVAFSVFAMLQITKYFFEISYSSNLDYFIFFGTITGYNFVKYAGVAKLHHRSLTNVLKNIQIFSFFCFLALCFFGYFLPIKTLLIIVPFTLLTILYAVPFLSGFQKNLRTVSYLKIIVVAIVWSGFTVLIPILHTEEIVTFSVVLYMMQRFLIVIVLILPFDIRDVKYDAISLQTIPKKIGIAKTKKLGLILMIISLIIEYLNFSKQNCTHSFLFFFLITIILLMRAKIEQHKYYSSFWVEALPIVWWLLLLGFNNFSV